MVKLFALQISVFINEVTVYFQVSLIQCNYTFKYGVILINYMYLLGFILGFGLGLLHVIMHTFVLIL